MLGYITTRVGALGQTTETLYHLHCPACNEMDLWLHVTGCITFAVKNKHQTSSIYNSRYERLVCHSCGVTAKGRGWHKLSPKRARTQNRQGLICGLITGAALATMASALFSAITSSC